MKVTKAKDEDLDDFKFDEEERNTTKNIGMQDSATKTECMLLWMIKSHSHVQITPPLRHL